MEKKTLRALKNVTKEKAEGLLKNKSFNKIVNFIKRKPSSSGEQVKELISCLIDKLENSFGVLSKLYKTQAVAQIIRFILKNKAKDALNSIQEKVFKNIKIKDCIKDIEIFEKYNTNLTADGRSYFFEHIVTIIGKAFFIDSEDSQKTFWDKSIEREGGIIDNLEHHKEKILEKISHIEEISFNSKFI